MSDLLLSEAQMRRIEPYFPLSHGVPRVDDRLIVSCIIFVLRNGGPVAYSFRNRATGLCPPVT